ncbi:Ger(x)C family spore germination C-terminal domain-containing protein [Paenisporosarcina antarctica]|uniref:Ger(x)C family spore germination C-terminal domain-containing protein n=1 Tax=Paenisporosarcina antarctica TaxID=417367 RepID=UPI0024448AA5|nr:Ger(x)C family spore germination C-terminal domain-containing protein [Paenisporosarcina antarctica]
MKGNVSKGKPEVDINIKIEGNVGEVLCEITLSEPETFDEVEKITEKEVEETVNQTET